MHFYRVAEGSEVQMELSYVVIWFEVGGLNSIWAARWWRENWVLLRNCEQLMRV